MRIYSRPLTKAEIAENMHDSLHRLEPEQAAGGDYGPMPPLPKNRNEECSGFPDPEDEKIPAAAAMLGVLVAIACAGLFPSSGPLQCLIASLVAGLLFVPLTTSYLTGWIMLLPSLAGGASVALTMRRQDQAVH